MKKLNGKHLVSALLAAAMVSFASVSAFAADYAVDPGYDEPEKVTEEAGTTPENPTSVVTDDTIKEVLKSDEPVVYIESDKATVKEDAIGEIAKGDTPVTFEAGEYSVTIDPADIEEVKSINLAMDITIVDEDTYDDVEVTGTAILITPAQKGDFGMTVTVTIPAASVKKLNTKSIFVYYVSDDGEITLLEDVVTVNADGSISISISHASSYLITDEEIPLFDDEDYEVEDDDDAAFDDDADDADDMVDEGTTDNNPGTGVACTAAALAAVSAAAVAVAAKKRK
ncbi:MAG: hypothetical protein ACI4KR_01435 [Ruminiclostridium sp.]